MEEKTSLHFEVVIPGNMPDAFLKEPLSGTLKTKISKNQII
jgi:hypothetical protein